MRKFFFSILLICIIIFATPLGSILEFNIGEYYYNSNNYMQAVSWYERALITRPKDLMTRFHYVDSLSKLEPDYFIQEKLFKISNTQHNDIAKNYAKFQINTIRNKLLKNYIDNYIANAVEGKDIIRWNIKSFPLKVYIKTGSNTPNYYKKAFERAFNAWTQNTNFVKFVYTDLEKDSDIKVLFEDSKINNCKENKCAYSVANTLPIFSGNKLQQMIISFVVTKPDSTYYNESEVYHTAIHEIGHALGIRGHSDIVNDVMFASNENIYSFGHKGGEYLSTRDLNTLVILYRLKPTISDKFQASDKSLYYPEFILGSNDELLNKKLSEWLNYIKKYPTLSSGYANAASIYFDKCDYDNALKYLNLAEQYSETAQEKYLINYNKALIYYNKLDKQNARIYAQLAKNNQATSEIDALIDAIDKL